MADLPAPPTNIRIIDQVMTDIPRKTAPPLLVIAGPLRSVRVTKSNVFVVNDRIRIPIRKPISANLVTINAFLEAATALGLE